MAFQGNLRDFSITEVLQMLGTQKKTGCLMLEWNAARVSFYVLDGRMVSTRDPGMSLEDPLLRFLIKARRLSNEQYRGIQTIQRESNRDLEDLLVNGRYLEAEELAAFIERQMLDDLMRVMTWQNGTYRFDPQAKWPNPPLARMNVEGALIEVARRVDEQQRFADLRRDPQRLVGVRDLPDSEEHLTEEECEMFGVIDGKHTVGEIIEQAPMSEYEAYEAMQRMLEANWIEYTGRRDEAVSIEATGGATATVDDVEAEEESDQPELFRQLIMAAGALLVVGLLAFSGHAIRAAQKPAVGGDAFQAASLGDVRFALDLYRREKGRYPERLEELIADRWITRDRVKVSGRALQYRPDAEGLSYQLEIAKH